MGFSFASVQLRITQNEAVVARSSRCCLSWQSLRPKPAQSPITMDTMDILLTVDTTDGVDITDTPTDTGNVMPKLHPLPLLLPPPMLMPAPNLGTLDTTDTLTDTGGRDLPKNNNQNLNILSNDPLMLSRCQPRILVLWILRPSLQMGRLLQRILRIRLSRLLLGLGLFHPRILSSDPTALTTYTHLSFRRHFQIQEIKI